MFSSSNSSPEKTCSSFQPVFHSLNFTLRWFIRSVSIIFVSSTFVAIGMLIPIISLLRTFILYSLCFLKQNFEFFKNFLTFNIFLGSNSPKSLSRYSAILFRVFTNSSSESAIPELILGIDIGIVRSGSISNILIISDILFSSQSVPYFFSIDSLTISVANLLAF